MDEILQTGLQGSVSIVIVETRIPRVKYEDTIVWGVT